MKASTRMQLRMIQSRPPVPRPFELEIAASIRNARSITELIELSNNNMDRLNDVNLASLLHRFSSDARFGGTAKIEAVSDGRAVISALTRRVEHLLKESF